NLLVALSLHDALPISQQLFDDVGYRQILENPQVAAIAEKRQFRLQSDAIKGEALAGSLLAGGHDFAVQILGLLGIHQGQHTGFRSEEHTSELQSRENL